MGVPEIEEYMKEVLPNLKETESFKKELLEIVVDVTEFLPDAVWQKEQKFDFASVQMKGFVVS